jgi:hypothetical protein
MVDTFVIRPMNEPPQVSHHRPSCVESNTSAYHLAIDHTCLAKNTL